MTEYVFAPAKINLSLDIIGINAKNYHLLETIMQSISLMDVVSVTLSDQGQMTKIDCNDKTIPLDKKNICYQAVELWRQKYFFPHSVSVMIQKNIPQAAGLAGGSANAAAVLLALQKMFDYPLSDVELFNLAATLGADVPFCLKGGCCLCEGIGEKMTALLWKEPMSLLLIQFDFGLSTAEVFKTFDGLQASSYLEYKPKTKELCRCLNKNCVDQIKTYWGNVLTAAAIKMRPEIMAMIEIMNKTETIGVQMSGSGPTIYALYENEQKCQSAKQQIEELQQKNIKVHEAKTIGQGVHFIDQGKI